MTAITAPSNWIRIPLYVGLGVLYLPIVFLVLSSFRAATMDSAWGGWSVQWYTELQVQEQILASAWTSLQIAAASATGATLLGVLAALALVRLTRPTARGLLGLLAVVPLVIPPVILGFSLLMLFVLLGSVTGWPVARGPLAIGFAHATLGAAYVTVIVAARLARLGTTLEEAAMDLGATPTSAFLRVSLPNVFPAVLLGWFISAFLSLNDLVIASFVAGQASETLPMALFAGIQAGAGTAVKPAAVFILGVVAAGAYPAWLLLRAPGLTSTDPLV